MRTPNPAQRRESKSFDPVAVLVTLIAAGAWFLALAVTWTLAEAAPEATWGMDSFYGVTRDPRWKPKLVSLAQSLTLALMTVSLVGLGFQGLQPKTERGPFKRSLIGFAALSSAGLVVFLFAA